MLQRTNATTNECYNKRMLQPTNDTTNECYNQRMLQRKNTTTNENYNERVLQRTVFINKIRMLQRTRRNTIGRRIGANSLDSRGSMLTSVRQYLRLLTIWNLIHALTVKVEETLFEHSFFLTVLLCHVLQLRSVTYILLIIVNGILENHPMTSCVTHIPC